MKFTVAIGTWNRASLLFQTLDNLTRVEPPAVLWELVVVNNNSTDETESVLDHFSERLPLRRVFEPEPGIANARNAAIRHANGEYIVWTDDDVLIDKEWLRAYERAVNQWPDTALFGGPVRPKFEGTPPAWLVDIWPKVAEVFVTRDPGKEPIELDGADHIPYGANYVVRTREQQKFPYDPNLGRKHGAGMLGEETAVIEAILASGGRGRWIPDADVQHWIRTEQQTIEYLRSYFTLLGKTHYREHRRGTDRLRGRRSQLRCQALCAELQYQCARWSRDPHRWFKPLVEASILRGALRR
jgi:glycosyltransferase involved in cell wall biosynthesis